MSVYSEFLRIALESDNQERSVAALISSAIALHSELDAGGDAASRLAQNLDYDVTLVRLCDAVGIEHHLTGDTPELIARSEAESRLAERLPVMATILLDNAKGPAR